VREALAPGDERGRLSDTEAVGTLACMVGGVVLARAVGADDSPAVLEACRAFLRRSARRTRPDTPAAPREHSTTGSAWAGAHVSAL
jgi:hypothetical protein